MYNLATYHPRQAVLGLNIWPVVKIVWGTSRAIRAAVRAGRHVGARRANFTSDNLSGMIRIKKYYLNTVWQTMVTRWYTRSCYSISISISSSSSTSSSTRVIVVVLVVVIVVVVVVVVVAVVVVVVVAKLWHYFIKSTGKIYVWEKNSKVLFSKKKNLLKYLKKVQLCLSYADILTVLSRISSWDTSFLSSAGSIISPLIYRSIRIFWFRRRSLTLHKDIFITCLLYFNTIILYC